MVFLTGAADMLASGLARPFKYPPAWPIHLLLRDSSLVVWILWRSRFQNSALAPTGMFFGPSVQRPIFTSLVGVDSTCASSMQVILSTEAVVSDCVDGDG